MVLRLRTLLANARKDEAAYRDLRERYRSMAKSTKPEQNWTRSRNRPTSPTRIESLARPVIPHVAMSQKLVSRPPVSYSAID
jgi:hypothetical protein